MSLWQTLFKRFQSKSETEKTEVPTQKTVSFILNNSFSQPSGVRGNKRAESSLVSSKFPFSLNSPSISSVKRVHREREGSSEVPQHIHELVNNRYKTNSRGSFITTIENISNPSDNDESIGILKLASAMIHFDSFKSDLLNAFDFSRAGRNKFSLSFPSAESTNDFVRRVWANRKQIFKREL